MVFQGVGEAIQLGVAQRSGINSSSPCVATRPLQQRMTSLGLVEKAVDIGAGYSAILRNSTV